MFLIELNLLASASLPHCQPSAAIRRGHSPIILLARRGRQQEIHSAAPSILLARRGRQQEIHSARRSLSPSFTASLHSALRAFSFFGMLACLARRRHCLELRILQAQLGGLGGLLACLLRLLDVKAYLVGAACSGKISSPLGLF